MTITYALQLAGFFLLGSIYGWGIDTTIRSLRRKRFTPIRKVPFSPLYGLGMFAFLFLPPPLVGQAWWVLALYFAVLFCTLEYVAGALILTVRKQRMWDYQGRLLNLHGHTDAFHFVLWGLLGVLGAYGFAPTLAGWVGL